MTIQRSTDGTTFTTVANVQGIALNGAAKEQIEATALNDGARVYVDGLPGNGQVTVTVLWDPADTTNQNLQADFSATNVSRTWKMTHPASGTVGDITFQGPVVGMQFSRGPNAVDTREYTIQISGALTEATT